MQQAQPYVLSLAAHIERVWERNRRAKEPMERQMIENLRQREGQYPPDKLQMIRDVGGSDVFLQLTAIKCRAAESWVRDILLSAGDTPWTLEPSGNPELPPALIQLIAAKAQMEVQTGVIHPSMFNDFQDWLKGKLQTIIEEEAEQRAEKMNRKVQSQLMSGGWFDALDDVISDIVTFKAGILKGPITRNQQTLTWAADYSPIVQNKLVQKYERVSPLDLYPSPGAVEIDDGDLIERARFTVGSLNELMGVDGYNDDAIRQVIARYGEDGLKNWLYLDSTRAQLENRPNEQLLSHDTIEGLIYWGSATGKMLMEWGVPGPLDPEKSYQIEAIKIGDYVIRAALNANPLKKRPYYKTGYEKVPGSFWYKGIPELMADIQALANACMRALANNLGIASGPQVEIHSDRLAPGETVTSLFPWKIWQTKSNPNGSGASPAVNFFQPSSNADALLMVYSALERMADNATGVPAYSYGDSQVGGAGSTASGMSMLMANASKALKMVIQQLDRGIIEPSVYRQFEMNMLYDPDTSCKGDLKVVARGSSSLIMKEQLQVSRMQLLQSTANPIDMQILGLKGRAEILRETVSGMHLPVDRIVPDADELLNQQAQANMQAQQQAMLGQAPGGPPGGPGPMPGKPAGPMGGAPMRANPMHGRPMPAARPPMPQRPMPAIQQPAMQGAMR